MYPFLMESLSVDYRSSPSSIHSDDETEHDAFFVQTCVEEVENAEYVAPLKPLLSTKHKAQHGKTQNAHHTTKHTQDRHGRRAAKR